MLFSGEDFDGLPRPTDTWVLQNATGIGGASSWMQLTTSGGPPTGRVSHSAVYASTSNRMIVYGGCLGNCSPAASDTWVLTNANGSGGTPTWSMLGTSGADGREGHAAVYDDGNNRMIVFGGQNAFNTYSSNPQVRVLTNADGTGVGTPTWTTLAPSGTPPSDRETAGAAYDDANNRMIVFGGATLACCAVVTHVYNDVWVLTNANGLGGTPEWTQLAPAGAPPAARYWHTAVYDPAANRLVVFGGVNQAFNTFYDDVWVLTNANGLGGTPEWVQLTPSMGPPLGRFGHAAGYNPTYDAMVVAMGRNDNTLLDDVWVLELDDQGPLTSNVAATPNPVAIDASTTVTATVDDSTTGGSDIASADYSLDGGPWTSMTAADGTFDEITEDVTATFSAPSSSDIYDLCVRGTDTAGNAGPESCIQLVAYDPSGGFVTGGGWIDSPPGATGFAPSWFQGFETDTAGWFDSGDGTVTRVPSGFADTYASGIDSADGDYHARLGTTEVGGCAPPFSSSTSCVGPFTRWGKTTSDNPTFPAGGYRTSVDVYLDTDWADDHPDWRFDFSSAINRSSDGSHLRDFAFNFGTDPGGDPNFVVNASTNAFRSSSFPSNPCPSPSAAPNICRTPVEITTSGWYTLQHTFRDDGGSLAVDMRILEESGATVADWTIYSGDAIGGVGGNRYGWFANQEVHNLPIDNSALYLPGPTGKATFGFVSKYRKGATVPTGNTQFVFQAGDINLHSSSYDWLVVTGSDYARFKGTADVNGVPGYGFMVWAGDGTGSDDADTFRIKITDSLGNTVYDNGMDQAIGGGSIIVHKAK